ncbi:MAG: (2Fe-2S)-binding protein, partial [Chloroflexi bacterium]
MRIHLTINGEPFEVEAAPYETLLTLLRREGFFSVKHGCEDGTCGACTVLVDGIPRPSCTMLAPQAQGRAITTVEGLSRVQTAPADRPGASIPIGWRGHRRLHALQEAFIETGAIQCGYCTPAMLLAAKALLDEEPNPTEAEVRDALSGILCRCTGYVKPVQAVLRA